MDVVHRYRLWRDTNNLKLLSATIFTNGGQKSSVDVGLRFLTIAPPLLLSPSSFPLLSSSACSIPLPVLLLPQWSVSSHSSPALFHSLCLPLVLVTIIYIYYNAFYLIIIYKAFCGIRLTGFIISKSGSYHCKCTFGEKSDLESLYGLMLILSINIDLQI